MNEYPITRSLVYQIPKVPSKINLKQDSPDANNEPSKNSSPEKEDLATSTHLMTSTSSQRQTRVIQEIKVPKINRNLHVSPK